VVYVCIGSASVMSLNAISGEILMPVRWFDPVDTNCIGR